MSIDINFTTVVLSVVTSSFGVAIAFYVKDYLEQRGAYRRLRARLERIAGKNAVVVYENPKSTPGTATASLYRIQEFDADGVVLKNDLHTIFVPIQAVLEEDIILPCEDYEKEIHKREREEITRFVDNMFPEMMKKIIETMKQELVKEFSSQGTEFNALIGVQVIRTLEENGFELRKLPTPPQEK